MDLPYPGIELGPPALQTDCLPTELPGMIIIIMAIMNSPAALAVCCWHPVGFSISNLPWEILVPLVLPSLGPLVTYQLESALESFKGSWDVWDLYQPLTWKQQSEKPRQAESPNPTTENSQAEWGWKLGEHRGRTGMNKKTWWAG